MERGIRRALHKVSTDNKEHPLGEYKVILDDISGFKDGLKIVNECFTKFSKYKSVDDSSYSKLGQGFEKGDQQFFKQMDKIQTFKKIMGLMGQTMTQIGDMEMKSHQRVRDVVRDKLEPVTGKMVTEIQKNASKLPSYETDYKISVTKADSAKANLDKLRRTGKAGSHMSSGLFGKAEMTEEDHQEKIRNLEADADSAESKLHDATEKVKLELLEFDAETMIIGDYFRILVNHMQMFHREAAAALDELMPRLENELSNFKPQFRLSSVSENCSEKQPIAKPVEVLINQLLTKEGLVEQGLFRLPGAISKVKQLVAALNAPCFNELELLEFSPCNQTLASCLKQFFRDLRHPVLRTSMDSGAIEAVEDILDHSEQFMGISEMLRKMDRYERYNLAYLCRFCREVMENHEQNLMTAHALAICWAPTLIGNTTTSGMGTLFVQRLIEEAQYFFPDEDYPHLANQNLSFDFTSRAAKFAQVAENQKTLRNSDYGFIEVRPKPTKKKAAPTPPNGVSLSSGQVSNPSRVQILHSSTPNLSARPRTKPPEIHRIQSNTQVAIMPVQRKPLKSPSVTTDYTGFGLMDTEYLSGQSIEASRGDNISLSDEISTTLESIFKDNVINGATKPATSRRPPRPPSTKSEDKKPPGPPPPTPKPRQLSSDCPEYTQL